MEDNREHPNPKGLEALESLGLGPGRLVEAAAEFERRLQLATGFKVRTYSMPQHQPTRISIVLTPDVKGILNNAAQFSFELFPGNQDIVVSTGAYVEEARRGFGLGSLLLRHRIDVAKLVGFQVILCTVENSNAKQLAALKKARFDTTYLQTNTATMYKKIL